MFGRCYGQEAETAIENSKPLTAHQLAEKACIWMATPEGTRNIQEAGNRAAEATRELERARVVSPAMLFEPFTI